MKDIKQTGASQRASVLTDLSPPAPPPVIALTQQLQTWPSVPWPALSGPL